ncbi:hypothetical protein [Microbacterium ulmi]|uniref:4-amino-4-deoxy-L-arabinose transferase n=1 Tax=Microbacterium ulmi TaxID=179095 RepID=A0A7Y2PZL1_9MICO|nr:hypothetical protein [Microbacterium ulmi]NII70365.1 hypothetical protein [Microbacterium ulmi]NNH03413.1 hypothetical protein [Microbacterium ulmi]
MRRPHTAKLEEASSQEVLRRESRFGSRHVHLLWIVWLLGLAAVAVGVLVRYGTPVGDIAIYGGYVVLGVAGPGWLVSRTLLGPMRSWASDLAVGGATGVVLTLFAWFAASILDVRAWLWAWPLATLFLLIPRRTRRRIFRRPTGSWHPAVQFAVASAAASALVHAGRSFMAVWELPPSDAGLYPDLLWHMSLVWEAMRAMPLGIPQAATLGPIQYHWFANADMAAAALVTRLDVTVIALRLWPAALTLLVIGLVAAAADTVARRQTAAAIAALLTAASVVFSPWWTQIDLQDALRPLSPSQLYVFVPLLLLIVAMTALARGRTAGVGASAVVVLSLVVAAGAKPTALPLVAAGCVAALVAALVLRAPWSRFAIVGALAAVIFATASVLVAGGGSGTSVRLLHVLTLAPFVRGEPSPPASGIGGWLILQLLSSPGRIAGSLLAVALIVVRPLFALGSVFERELRRDPIAWWMSGMCGAAIAAALVLGHPGYSELYFAYTAIPVGAILAGWWIAASVDGDARRRRVAIGAVLGGAVFGWAMWAVAPWLSALSPARIWSSLAWTAAVLAAAAAAIGLALALRRRQRRPSLPSSIAAAFVVGVIIASLPYSVLGPASSASARSSLSLAQSEAAEWLSQNTTPDQIMAVNDHCLGDESEKCDSRVWWVSGLAGRRVLVESWSYVAASTALEPSSVVRPVFDEKLLEFNQELFASPSRDTLREAYRLGVRYLIATEGESSVSPELAVLAEPVYSDSLVTIYRVPRP